MKALDVDLGASRLALIKKKKKVRGGRVVGRSYDSLKEKNSRMIEAPSLLS